MSLILGFQCELAGAATVFIIFAAERAVLDMILFVDIDGIMLVEGSFI